MIFCSWVHESHSYIIEWYKYSFYIYISGLRRVMDGISIELIQVPLILGMLSSIIGIYFSFDV